MLLYFLLIFSLYYIFIGFIIFGWERIHIQIDTNSSNLSHFVSVVIALRNEEKNILNLLSCLSKQSLASSQYEVILIDDGSEDNTVHEIQEFMKSAKLDIRLLKNKFDPIQGITPKKAALLKGIEASSGDLIVMTDGDCWFGAQWLNSILAPFGNKKTMFVSGPVALTEDRNVLSKLQTMEFSSLIGTGGAMIGLNYPLMCNGANLAFRKTAFQKVNGYEGYEDNTSGDDVFLMQKIHKAFSNSITFQKDPKAIVRTFPQPSISSLISQRKRWASKWNKYVHPFSWAIPVFLAIHYISFIAGIITTFLMPQLLLNISLLILLKFFLDYIILKKIMFFCNLRFRMWIFLFSEILYPFYALFIGVLVHFGNYQWKGRTHKV